MSDKVRRLPTEVELAIDLQPCLAERRTYEPATAKHPCEFFADQGTFHSFDLKDVGPPHTRSEVQPSVYAGRRRVTPEMLSGCRKAPIMAVGINPNLPVFWEGKHNSLLPVFDDVLQYAHHYRYRGIAKLQIPETQYKQLLAGRKDDPLHGEPLAPEGTPIETERANQVMYEAYESLLTGLADEMGWTEAKLSVGEDLSYGNMVACGSPRWITRRDPKSPSLPVMTEHQRSGVVHECFVERRHFLRQLFQSLPRVLLVFSAATRDAFIRAMDGHFTKGAPEVGEDLEELLGREIVLRYGQASDGAELAARVLFVPHASGNPQEFKRVRTKVIAALVEEARAGRLELDSSKKHLLRPRGGCTFCDNALYKIGPCDYVEQLVPLAGEVEESASDGAEMSPELLERAAQNRLLDAFLGRVGEIEEAESGGAPQQYVVYGRIVTMDKPEVFANGAIYIRNGVIEDVRLADASAPEGYDEAPRVKTRGTIYPGLIDLHNHLAYNVLPPWAVPRKFDDRSQWRRARDYAARIGLMRRLKAGTPAKAVARYVEVKALLGAVTTLQGLRSSFPSVSGAMRGLVRNVEQGDELMPRAGSSVIDLDPRRKEILARFREAVKGDGAYFYHLSEGVNDAARAFWRDLVEHELLGPSLVGIHCLALPPSGYKQLAKAKCSLIWSPTSNLMLYGETVKLQAVLDSGVSWAIGCDWSVTGAKNPLFELKVARAEAQRQGVSLRAKDLVAAVTTNAARVTKWDKAIGRIAKGYRADLVVMHGASADPYEQLVAAVESDLVLSIVDGVPRAGDPALFDDLRVPVKGREIVDVGGRKQALWLREPGTPLDKFTLDRAAKVLHQRMLSKEDTTEEAAEEFDTFQLELDDEMEPLPPEGEVEEAAVPIVPQTPDVLTVLEDNALWKALESIEHFPLDVAKLRDYYR